MSVIGAKSSASAAAARSIAAPSNAPPGQRRLGRGRALRRRRHAAEGDAAPPSPCRASSVDAERAHHRGDILVEALGDLVAGEAHVRL